MSSDNNGNSEVPDNISVGDSMTQFLSILGRIFIFGTFLPGLIGYILLCILYPNLILQDSSWLIEIGFIFAVGFIANSIGHFSELFLHAIHIRKFEDTYALNLIKIWQGNKNIREKFESFYGYSAILLMWYWNSAVIISIILIVKLFVIILGIVVHYYTFINPILILKILLYDNICKDIILIIVFSASAASLFFLVHKLKKCNEDMIKEYL